ncbi:MULTISPECIES: MaoC family dehydratase [unclassified Micromonospora]|uniref:MaoC family dehydratase n=1 Tax=unclassified Micromonospora TaxID=2617518 RepID=UPI002FF35FBE
MRVFATPDELTKALGDHLGYSDWHLVDQARVDAFAEATGDRQWIHVDPERARSGPFGGTVAHGFLMLSLLPALGAEVYRVEGIRMGVNYGLDRVRFPAPLPTGSRVRAGVSLLAVEPVAGGLQVSNEVTLEREGGDKPCCVARTLARLYV